MAGVYTAKGGMKAVIWTDFVQSVVMIGVGVYVFCASAPPPGAGA